MDGGGGDVDGQGDGQAPAARAEVQRGRRGMEDAGLLEKFPRAFGQQFRFRAGRQHMGIDAQFQSAKRRRAGDILERLAPSAPLHQRAHGVQLFLRQRALETQVELHARHLERMSQEMLHLQPRRGNPFFGQEIRAALDDFKNGHL